MFVLENEERRGRTYIFVVNMKRKVESFTHPHVVSNLFYFFHIKHKEVLLLYA